MAGGGNVLVTGGAGAIGSNLVRQLRREGRRVVVVDDLSSGHHPPTNDDGCRFSRGQVQDPEILDEAFREPIDSVYHLAALFANQNSVDHPEEDLAVNGLGTLRVLERARLAGVRRFVYISSSCVYASSSHVLTEESTLDPETPYASTKLLGEHYTRFFRQHFGLSTVSLRLFNVFGPGEMPGRYRNVIPNFIARARAHEPLMITGRGDEGRTFTYVDDVVRALLLAGGPGEPRHTVYNVASDNYCTIRDLAKMIIETTGSTSPVINVESRSWDRVTSRRASWLRAYNDLGYRPEVSLRDGLLRTVAWFGELPRCVAAPQTH
jgi:nucleoside-diphosphate-sugar epimerase